MGQIAASVAWLTVGWVLALNVPAAQASRTNSQAVEVVIASDAHPVGNLTGWWWPAPINTASPDQSLKPTILLLHGCEGMLNDRGLPNTRTRTYAKLLGDQGWNVLALDSFSGRGVRQICTRAPGTTATVKQAVRRQDAWAALQWLVSEPGVDPERLALIGWSNGGSTVLDLTHEGFQPGASVPRLRLGVAFYPGCTTRERQGYAPVAPMVLMLGLADDWTPAAPCQRLASERVTVLAWEDAHHGFDSTSAVRWRSDVRRGINPAGVHVGGDPAARQAAQRALLARLHEAFR